MARFPAEGGSERMREKEREGGRGREKREGESEGERGRERLININIADGTGVQNTLISNRDDYQNEKQVGDSTSWICT